MTSSFSGEGERMPFEKTRGRDSGPLAFPPLPQIPFDDLPVELSHLISFTAQFTALKLAIAPYVQGLGNFY